MESFAAKLRRIRGNQSKRTFARILGISEKALHAYESGKRLPRDEIRLRIYAAAGREAAKNFKKGVHN